MIANTNNISKFLGIVPETKPVEIIETTPIVVTEDTSKLEADYEYARKNMKDVIENAKDAYHELIDVAKASQTGAIFSAVAEMTDKLIMANEKLVNLSQQKVNIEKQTLSNKSPDSTGPNSVHNHLHLSTKDLLKLMKGDSNE